MATFADIKPGAILRVKRVTARRDTYVTVRVLAYGRIIENTTESGFTYATFPGIRIRPTELNCSFGNDKYYTARLSNIEVIRSAA